MVTPAFHANVLREYVGVMNEQAAVLVGKMREQTEEDSAGGFDLGHAIQLCALDIICETAMGCKVNAQQDPEHVYVRALDT